MSREAGETTATSATGNPPPPFQRSAERGKRAARTLAGGVSTAFRRHERPVPLVIQRATGSHLTDIDGNEYVDFACGFGPIILGHGDPEVSDAVARAARGVQQVGAQSEDEFRLAELLCETVPSFASVRLSLSGSESVHAAVRLARAATGRTLVAKFAGHYHGWLDSIFTATTTAGGGPESQGQPASALAEVAVLPWNDREALEAFFATRDTSIAALVMEPYPCNGGVIPPEPGFLETARTLTERSGSVLIFDEVITGYRLGLGGAQAQLNVMPDLTVVAKAMGNGFPVSAFGGRRDLMDFVADNRVVHAGTYNGGGISVAAGLATIRALSARDPYPGLRERGVRLRDGLVEVAAQHGQRLVAQGPGPVFFTWFLTDGEVRTFADHQRADREGYAAFADALLREGIRVIPAGRWYLSAAHTDHDVDAALDAADRAFDRMNAQGH